MIHPGSVCSATRIARVLEIRGRRIGHDRGPVRARCRDEQPRPCRSSPDCTPGPRALPKIVAVVHRARASRSDRPAAGRPRILGTRACAAPRAPRSRSSWSGPRRKPAPRRLRGRRRRAVVEQIERVEPPAELDEDAADAAEQPRPLEPQVLAIANPPLRVPQHPREDHAPQGMRRPAPPRRAASPRSRSRSAAEPDASDRLVPPAAASCCASEPTARNSGSGSSCSVALSSFSSLTVRSPNFARYSSVLARRSPAGRRARPGSRRACRESAAVDQLAGSRRRRAAPAAACEPRARR